MHKPHRPTSAWPLSLALLALVVYASLYPFTGWRDQGISPFVFLNAALPHYWNWFDVGVNLAGYAPLGLLLAVSVMNTSLNRWSVLCAVLLAALLSLCMETLQSYLPMRVPSNLDLLLNTCGAGLGAGSAWALQRWGVMERWELVRARWFASDAHGALVLLALWPAALLFPADVPLGLGQVYERLESNLAALLADTPFLDWLPVREVELQALEPMTQSLCVALGLILPCLLGFAVIRTRWQRVAFALGLLAVGVAFTALSTALSYGPENAWGWLGYSSRMGLGWGLVASLLLLPLSPRACAGVAVLALLTQLVLLNQSAENAYFSQTLQIWEQGQFIRFNGVAQWLGWLWPYAALGYLFGRVRPFLSPPPAGEG